MAPTDKTAAAVGCLSHGRHSFGLPSLTPPAAAYLGRALIVDGMHTRTFAGARGHSLSHASAAHRSRNDARVFPGWSPAARSYMRARP
jgi:hypothetical protein